MQTLTKEQIEEIQNDPTATMYDVEYDEVERVISAEELSGTIEVIRGIYTSIRASHPEKTDEEIRAEIMDRSEAARKMGSEVNGFKPSHPRLFKMVTSRATKDKDYHTLAYCLYLRGKVETGEMEEDASRMELFKRLAEEDESV